MNTLLLACVLVCSVGGLVGRAPDGTSGKIAKVILEGFSKPEKDNSVDDEEMMMMMSYETPVATTGDYSDTVTMTSLYGDYDYYEEDGISATPRVFAVDVDENGCHVRQKKELEDQCFEAFQGVIPERDNMPVTVENKKAVCCALEEYEKCSRRAYFSTQCNGDMKTLRENLKAARVFLRFLSGISCSGHFRESCMPREQQPSTPRAMPTSLYVLLALLILMILAKLLW